MPERYSVRSHAEFWTPFLRDGFRESRYPRFRDAVVRLTCVTVRAGCGGDVDDGSGGAVGDAEIGGGFADEAEGGGGVDVEHEFVLLVGHFVDHGVVGEAGVVDDTGDFAVAEGGGGFDECGDIIFIEDIAGDGEGAGWGDGVDAVR